MEIISKLAEFFGFKSTENCGVCNNVLDKDYGEIVYVLNGSTKFQTMKICSVCVNVLEESHQRTVNTIEKWKKDDSV